MDSWNDYEYFNSSITSNETFRQRDELSHGVLGMEPVSGKISGLYSVDF